MASGKMVSVVAVVGIAAASAAAWWYQSQPRGPTEIAGSMAGAAAASAAAGPTGKASAPAAAASAPRAAGVEVAQVELIRLRDDAQSVGTLRSRQSVMLRPEVAGRIAALGFSDGARVRKGQMLVQLDDTLQRAELSQAQAQVSIAQSTFNRNQELVAQNFVAKRALEESAAALQVAQAQLALAQARQSRMRIVAPFDGVAGIRVVNIGDFVKDGADLVNIEDLSTMLVDFKLPERVQSRLRVGQPVEVQLDAFPGRKYTAKIDAIDPLLDINGRSVSVRASMPNSAGEASVSGGARPSGPASPAGGGMARAGDRVGGGAGATAGGVPGPLRSGMFARVTAVFAVRDNAAVVPEEAIVPQGGRQFVIKVVAPSAVPGTATAALGPDVKTVSQRQEVKLGLRRQGKVEILEGVAPGDTIVIAGQQRLQRDGTPVRIVETGRPAGGPPGGGGGPGGGTGGAGPGGGAVGAPTIANPSPAAGASGPRGDATPPAPSASGTR